MDTNDGSLILSSYLLINKLIQLLDGLSEQLLGERLEFHRQLGPVLDVRRPLGQEAVVADEVGGAEVDLLQRLLGEGADLRLHLGLGPVLEASLAGVPEAVGVTVGGEVGRVSVTSRRRRVAAGDDGDVVGVILVIRPCGDQEVILLIEEDSYGGGHVVVPDTVNSSN